MTHIEDVLLWSLAQKGDRYVFGAEVPLGAPDSDKWDCSELIEWSCGKAGVVPKVPDGAYYQWRHTMNHGGRIPVTAGLRTRGALLFAGDGTGVGRSAITHVAWSLGDLTTIEARGSKWGVGCWSSINRFQFAGMLPGIDYSPRNPLPPPEDFMAALTDAEQKELLTRVRDLHAAVTNDKDPNAVAKASLIRRLATKLGVTGV